jgi:farnesol dehydrogenase
MNRVFVTGATGFLGMSLVKRLLEEGNMVHALYRSEEKIRGWEESNLFFFKGSLGDRDSIERAMRECSQVYHLAAFASVWAKDPKAFYRENVDGTVHVLEAALKNNVKRLVFTSTAGVLGPSNGTPNTEEKQFSGQHFTHYDRSKDQAEGKVREYCKKGGEAVIVNPSRIYGPGNLSQSNSVSRMIASYLRGKWKIIPGDGTSIGNYVYVEDVVSLLLIAMEKGLPGERYLAGGENLSFNGFFEILSRISGRKHRMYRLPVGLMMAVAGTMQAIANLTGWPPAITPAFVRRYNQNWAISIDKSIGQLGYNPLSFEEGLIKTIEWIKSQHLL